MVSKRVGPGATVRLWSGQGSSAGRSSISSSSGRATSISGTGRRSRLSMIRETLLSVLPPIPKSIAAIGVPIFALGAVLALGVTVFLWMALTGRLPDGIARHMPFGSDRPSSDAIVPPPLPENAELADDLVGPSAEPGRASVGRGVLLIPKTFRASKDGAFDFVIHFHGNTDLALASYEVALLDSVVLVVNLGNGSGAYEDHYRTPANLDRVLSRIPEIVRSRGLESARIGRVALVGWSAGYGAIIHILRHEPHAERVDAVVLLDGLHTSYLPGTNVVDGLTIESVTKFAERAKRGEKIFVLTHSEIRPDGYLGVRETTDFLLGRLGLDRRPATAETAIPTFRAAQGVLPKKDLRPLVLKSEAREGNFVVRGFEGVGAPDHIGHLLQMSEVALPELAKRWYPAVPEAAATTR